MGVRVWLTALAATVVTGCGGGQSSAPPAGSAPTSVPATSASAAPTSGGIAVDTDLAADDLVALLYLLSRPDAQIRAVTVSGTGEVRCPRGEEIARSLLALAGKDGVPVGCGRATPVEGNRAFPDGWRDAADAAYGLDLPAAAGATTSGNAVDVLGDVAAGGRGMTLLTLGPLTNVAAALDAGVDLGAAFDRVVMMGGAVDVPGNVVPDGASSPLPAEWNMWVDPTAAARVVGSGVPVVLVPLDATNAVPLGRPVVDRLAANLPPVSGSSPAAAQLVHDLWLGNPGVADGSAYLWDPLAALAAAQPGLMPTDLVRIAVEAGTGSFAGSTRRSPAGTDVEVLQVPDPDAVVDELLRGLVGLEPTEQLVAPTTVAPVGEATVGFDGTTCRYEGPLDLPAGNLRLTLEPTSAPGTVVVVAHVLEGTVEEAVAWSAAHPQETPPMVDAIGAMGEGNLPSPADLRLLPGTNGVVCTVSGALVVGATVTAR